MNCHMAELPAAAVVTDSLLNGSLKLRQFACGHRAGTDAVLLAAAAGAPQGLVMDIGAGSGAAGLMLALRAPLAQLCCIEIDPATAGLARENIALNGFAERAQCHTLDVLSPKARRAAGLADGLAQLVITNPPFFEAARVRVSPDAARARAHAGHGNVAEPFLVRWLRACTALLAPGGQIVLIHRADALGDLLAALAGRAGGLRLLPVYPRASQQAIRLLAAATKGSRAPPSLLPPLVLHEADGRFTARAQALHNGEDVLAL